MSSAFKKVLAPIIDILVKSFIHKRKNSVPRIDPWGTPDFIYVHLDDNYLWSYLYRDLLFGIFSKGRT
jgi:hypothetical protein